MHASVIAAVSAKAVVSLRRVQSNRSELN